MVSCFSLFNSLFALIVVVLYIIRSDPKLSFNNEAVSAAYLTFVDRNKLIYDNKLFREDKNPADRMRTMASDTRFVINPERQDHTFAIWDKVYGGDDKNQYQQQHVNNDKGGRINEASNVRRSPRVYSKKEKETDSGQAVVVQNTNKQKPVVEVDVSSDEDFDISLVIGQQKTKQNRGKEGSSTKQQQKSTVTKSTVSVDNKKRSVSKATVVIDQAIIQSSTTTVNKNKKPSLTMQLQEAKEQKELVLSQVLELERKMKLMEREKAEAIKKKEEAEIRARQQAEG
jgi:hypothetical protein